MKFFRFILTLIALTATVKGQEPPEPVHLPKPIMVRVPDFAKWTITYESLKSTKDGAAVSDSATPPTVVAKRTVVTKTGEIRHESTIDATGQQTDKWCKGAIQIEINAKGGLPVILDPNSMYDSTYVDYSKSDFADLDWIAQDNFTGIKTVMGKSCWSFQKTRTFYQSAGSGADPSNPPPSIRVVYTAYIDKATQLPVQLKIGENTASYTFEAPPAEMQTLPASLQKTVSGLVKREKALSAPLPRPF